jgi:hypothetical protein
MKKFSAFLVLIVVTILFASVKKIKDIVEKEFNTRRTPSQSLMGKNKL